MSLSQHCQSYKSILIIDSDPEYQCSLSNVLQSQGLKVKKTISGKTSVQVAKQELPDLILLDINIPEINGYEVYRQLKTQGETANTPIIFISTLEQTLERIQSFDIGRIDYGEKFFQESKILAPIKNKSIDFQEHQSIITEDQRLWIEIGEEQKAKKDSIIANNNIEVFAIVDELTGVANRKRFDEYLNLEWRRISLLNLPLSLLICDADFFQIYNDTHDNFLGDSCLQKIAKAIQLSVRRSTDLVARYQQEKFAIILPNTEFEGAVYLSELIRQKVCQLKIPYAQSITDEFLSLNIGLATTFPNQRISPNTLIEVVKKALNEAKVKGRNLIVARKMI